MATGVYEKASASMPADPRLAAFGGWLAVFWCFAMLLVVWYSTSATGTGTGLARMFETPENAAIMRVVLWVKVWLWAPFLIMAPLGHRLMPPATNVTLLLSAGGESYVVWRILELEASKVVGITAFNVLIVLALGAYLVFSPRARAIRKSTKPVDVRVRRHFTLLVLVAGTVSVALFGGAAATATDRVSFLTAYLFMALLAAALALGPLRTLRTGRTTVNMHLRRDVAIWSGIAALLHLFTGLGQSMNPIYVSKYIGVIQSDAADNFRQQLFSWGVVVGLVIAVLVLLLLALSNDRSLRRIGKKWWKRLHRTSYVIFALTIAHAFLFQLLEDRALWIVAGFAVAVCGVVLFQLAGFLAVRRKRRRRRSRPRFSDVEPRAR